MKKIYKTLCKTAAISLFSFSLLTGCVAMLDDGKEPYTYVRGEDVAATQISVNESYISMYRELMDGDLKESKETLRNYLELNLWNLKRIEKWKDLHTKTKKKLEEQIEESERILEDL